MRTSSTYPRPSPARVRWSRSTVWTRRFESSVMRNSAKALVVGLGAEGRQRSVVTRSEHPPGRLALPAVLADQHRRAVVEAEPHHAALRAGGLGGGLDVEPAGLGQVDEDAHAVVEGDHQVLAPPPDAGDGASDERRRLRLHRLERGEPVRIDPGHDLPGQGGVEALGKGLHLGKLGHGRLHTAVRGGPCSMPWPAAEGRPSGRPQAREVSTGRSAR